MSTAHTEEEPQSLVCFSKSLSAMGFQQASLGLNKITHSGPLEGSCAMGEARVVFLLQVCTSGNMEALSNWLSASPEVRNSKVLQTGPCAIATLPGPY